MKKIHIEIIGQGPPLILIHGWGWHSGVWQPIVPKFKSFQLFLVDLPGFGKSPILTNDYTFAAIAEVLLPQLPPTATWLGWSLGGMFTWWLAIHHPEKISKLITVAASPRFIADDHWPGVAASTLDKFTSQLVKNYQNTLTDFLELQLRGSPDKEKLFAELQPQLTHVPATAIPALLGGLKLLKETDLRSDLHKVTCPSLHLFGQRDVLVPVKVASLIKAHCEIIPKAGHMPFLTHTEQFLNYIYNPSKYCATS